MASKFKSLVNKAITKETEFMGDSVTIRKLTVAQVLTIQDMAQKKSTDDTQNGFDMIKEVIKMSVADASDATDEDFKTFPMDELTKLSNEIMVFSGISSAEGK